MVSSSTFRTAYLLLLSIGVGRGLAAIPQVTTGQTVVSGLEQTASGTEFFGGIPYAKPPVGDLRFAPPVLTSTLSGATFDASKYGPACTQSPLFFGAGMETSEDCLTIDVVRPAGVNASSKLPVMAWIHGGGFAIGYPAQYNGTTLVARSIERGTPIIYASIAYRLGAFGFPNGVEAVKQGALNLGLKDMIAALQWVQANIETFGGDKSKVTIFGESAGAMAIGDLYLNSKLETLARAAIFESGSALANLSPGVDDVWKAMAKAVPACADAASDETFTCLRKATAKDIQDAQDKVGSIFPFFPVVDGSGGIVPDRASALIAKGGFTKLPFIAGTNLDEGTLFTPDTINSTASVRAFLTGQLVGLSNDASAQNNLIEKLLAAYSEDPAAGSPFGTGNNTFGRSPSWKRASAMSCDIQFTSTRREWITAASTAGVKSYGYLFTDPQPGELGVTHGTEIPYVFGPTAGFLNPDPAAGTKTLSPIMMDYWISFASSLDPNDGKGATRPQWPTYSTASPMVLQLKSDSLMAIADDFRKEAIGLILANPAAFGR